MTAGHSPWDSGHSPWDSQWDGTGRPPGGHYRASDADRDRVINVLKTAFTEGRLTADEFEERTAAEICIFSKPSQERWVYAP